MRTDDENELPNVKGVWSDAPPATEEPIPMPERRVLRAPPLPRMVDALQPPSLETGRDSIESLPPEALESLPPPPASAAPPPVPRREPPRPPKRKRPVGLPATPSAVKAAPSQPTRGPEAPPPLLLELPQPPPPEKKSRGWVPAAVGFTLGVAATAVVAYLAVQRVAPVEQPATTVEGLAAETPAEPEIDLPAIQPPAPAVEAPLPSTVSAAEETEADTATEEPAVPAALEEPARDSARRAALDAHAQERRARRRAEAPQAEERDAPAAASAGLDDEPVRRPEPRAEPDGDLPSHPSREDVANAIESIRADLLACAPEAGGQRANIRFTFSSTGRATSALVPNDFHVEPQQRSCVARTARRARVPAFSEPRLVVTYPVQF